MIHGKDQSWESQKVGLEWGILSDGPECKELIFRQLCAPGAFVDIISFEQMMALILPVERMVEKCFQYNFVS